MCFVEFCCFERSFTVKSTFLDLRADRKEFWTDKIAATCASGSFILQRIFIKNAFHKMRDALCRRKSMNYPFSKTNHYRLIKGFFDSKQDFIVLGLCGKTGSGSTTVADILQKIL